MKHKLVILIALFICASCQPEKDKYFYGNMHTYQLPEQAETLAGREITFDSVQTGDMFVHDSLIFFASSTLPRYSVYAFNTKTGEYLFGLFGRGQGPLEYRNVVSLYKRLINDQTHIYFEALNEHELIDVNIDRLMTYINNKENDSIKAAMTTSKITWFNPRKLSTLISPLDEQRILTMAPTGSPQTGYQKTDLLQFEIIDLEKDSVTTCFPIFAREVSPQDFSNAFYIMTYTLRSDKKKLAIAMSSVPQLNILDIETGQMECFRLKDALGMEYLERCSMEDIQHHYKHIAADNKYVYILYSGKPLFQEIENKIFPGGNEVHVFDWEGNFIRRLSLKARADEIRLDEKNNLLYAHNYVTDQVFVYSLNQ